MENKINQNDSASIVDGINTLNSAPRIKRGPPFERRCERCDKMVMSMRFPEGSCLVYCDKCNRMD